MHHRFRRYGALTAKVALSVGALLLASACTVNSQQGQPLAIREQGSFTAGGTVAIAPGTFSPQRPLEPHGQTFHGDHAYVFYQIPVDARKYPIVMWHGAGQFSKTWETTADGRDGFQNLFLRERFPVYLVDQPRRGNAGRSMVREAIEPTPDEQFWFNQFRLGVWPEYFPGVQFARDPETLNQYFRSMTPNTGPFDPAVAVDGISGVFERIGPGILFSHSQSGGLGWLAATKNQNIKAIVSFEPGSGFVFPKDEVPEPIPNAFDTVQGVAVSPAQFMALTHIPILIVYGDNIPDSPVSLPTQDAWRARLQMAKLWRDTVNRHGGDVTILHLPEIGIHGNTHFPFSDLNNRQIAELVSRYLAEKKLD